MADRNEKYRRKITDACQPYVDEPIRQVGMFQPRGTTGAAAMLIGGSALAGGIMRRSAQSAAGGVPDVGLYALTDTALHVLEGKPKGTGWKVKRHAGSWPRSSFTAQPVAGKVTDQVELTFTDGGTIGLESIRFGSQGFNADIINALTANTAV